MFSLKRGSTGAALFAVHVLLVGAACAGGGSGADDFATPVGGGGTGHDAATTGPAGDDVDSASPGTGDDGSAANGTDGSGDDAGEAGASGDDDGSMADSAPPEAAASPTYACVTGLSPAPVCDAKHANCLCTADAECNSRGTNIGNKGGCNSGHCAGGACTGGQFTDSAGCSIVSPFCNAGNANACPTGTTCEINHGQCGGSVQCCWCTSDTACPVSGKCIDDATQHQCTGGACTGTGTNWDGMHCQLASPGIPMCSMQ
jgi:hypothetical protein